jgi:Response regulator containing CheY-like receiver domain and AraC-type DNA-binding domain
MYNVLIVEDNKAIQRNIRDLTMKTCLEHHICGIVGNGEKALEFIRSNEVDIIITDIKMPVMGGLELIKEAVLLNPEIQYIIISGYDDFSYAKEAISLGVKEYLLKPVVAEEFGKALVKVSDAIRHLKERDTKINSVELSEIIQTSWVQSDLQDLVNKENLFLELKLTPIIIHWNENELAETIGSLIDHWFEKNYTKNLMRILLLSITEIILRNKQCLGCINMVQPVENILAFSDSYYHLKQVSVEFYRALYKKVNEMIMDQSYSTEHLFEEVKKYIDAHLYDILSMGQLQEKFHVSASYINRLFKKYMSVAPMTYYNQRKLEEAKNLLISDRNYMVKDISEALSYQNQYYFSKAFKAYTGNSPLEYREKNNNSRVQKSI